MGPARLAALPHKPLSRGDPRARAVMRSYVTTTIWAGLITGISVVGNIFAVGFISPARRLVMVAALPAVPGELAAALIGIGHGVHGFPTHVDVAPYVFTFFLWWGLINLARNVWGTQLGRP